jgi:hypothetical protein
MSNNAQLLKPGRKQRTGTAENAINDLIVNSSSNTSNNTMAASGLLILKTMTCANESNHQLL